jgi:meiosis arrest female protein 1
VSVFYQSDGNFAAAIRVSSPQDAQYAISKLHRRKIGFKRIMIAYAHSGYPQNPTLLRYLGNSNNLLLFHCYFILIS